MYPFSQRHQYPPFGKSLIGKNTGSFRLFRSSRVSGSTFFVTSRKCSCCRREERYPQSNALCSASQTGSFTAVQKPPATVQLPLSCRIGQLFRLSVTILSPPLSSTNLQRTSPHPAVSDHAVHTFPVIMHSISPHRLSEPPQSPASHTGQSEAKFHFPTFCTRWNRYVACCTRSASALWCSPSAAYR